jgi:hypothetical protein
VGRRNKKGGAWARELRGDGFNIRWKQLDPSKTYIDALALGEKTIIGFYGDMLQMPSLFVLSGVRCR